jgi:O-antigen ligase
MLKRLGIETHLQLVILLCTMSLIIVTPLGGSGGAPAVFFLYRSLLVAITILCTIGCRRAELRISRPFIAAMAAGFLLMLLSVLTTEGSHFEGFYLWYKHVFFIAAFASLAWYARFQSAGWKGILLGTVILNGLIHLVPELIINHRPIAGFSQNNVNYFGTYLLVGLAASVAVALFGTRSDWRVSGGLGAAVLFFGISQTWSRGATLAAGAMLLVAAYRAGNRIPRRIWIVVGVLGVVVVVFATPFLLRKFLDRGEADPYNYARTQIWRNSLPIIAAHPLLGVGFGQYTNVSKRFAFPVEGQVARYLKRAQIAHSEYLQHAAELGIPATAILLSLLGYALYLAWQRAESAWPEYRCFHEAAILTAVGVGTHAVVDNCWTIPVTASSLVVIALADVLPLAKDEAPKRLSNRVLCIVSGIVVMLYLHSVVVPALGLYYNDRGHRAYLNLDYGNAERFHRAALRVFPNHPTFLDNLGMVYLQQFTETKDKKLLEKAHAYFTLAVKAAPDSIDPLIHMETVLLQSLNGNEEHDIAVYKQLIEYDGRLLDIDPFLPFPRKNLAAALYQVGQRENAFVELKKALQYEPNYVPGYLQIAAWYRDVGQNTESELYQKTAVVIVTKYHNFKPQLAYEGLLLGRPAETIPRN